MKNKRSFTLIELLVVIAVLAGLMALLVPNFMQVRIKSRDMRRKSDLRSIQKALELYKLNQVMPTLPVYPAMLSFNGTLSDNNGIYMQVVPQDPLGVSRTYYYVRAASDSLKYTLCACLENKNDSDGGACTTSGGVVAGAPACSETYYKLNEP